VSDTDARRQAYWRATMRLTAVLLLLWGGVSFLPGWFAEEMNTIVFLGWPVGFYMAAQGALIVFLLIVWLYDRWMTRIERRYGMYNED
jgi:putative solute:sodium symporter small subunit